MTWDEWDEFTCVPMRHNDDLDSIRRRCVEMETSEFCTRENSQEQETWIYNQKGLDEVKKLLTELEKGIQPAGGAYVSPAAGDPTAHP